MFQQMMTSANLSARASDLSTPLTDATAMSSHHHHQQHTDATILNTRALFASVSARHSITQQQSQQHGESLFIFNSDGQLTEYTIVVTSATRNAKYTAEAQVQLALVPTAQWGLHRYYKLMISNKYPYTEQRQQ